MKLNNDIKKNFKNSSGIPMTRFINALDKQFDLFDTKGEKKLLLINLQTELLDTLISVDTARLWPTLVEIRNNLTEINREDAILVQIFAKRLHDIFIDKKSDLIIDKKMFKEGWYSLFEHYVISLNEKTVRERHLQKYHRYKHKLYNDAIEKIKKSFRPKSNFNGVILSYTEIAIKDKTNKWTK